MISRRLTKLDVSGVSYLQKRKQQEERGRETRVQEVDDRCRRPYRAGVIIPARDAQLTAAPFGASLRCQDCGLPGVCDFASVNKATTGTQLLGVFTSLFRLFNDPNVRFAYPNDPIR